MTCSRSKFSLSHDVVSLEILHKTYKILLIFNLTFEENKPANMSRPVSSLSNISKTSQNPETSKRLAAYRKVFNSFDKNGDEEIDLDEVCEALGIDYDQAYENMTFSDVNRDGKISFNEFYLLVRLEQQKIERFRQIDDSRWKMAFCSFDKDDNGLIQLDEFHKFWKAVDRQLTKPAIDLLFTATSWVRKILSSLKNFMVLLCFH